MVNVAPAIGALLDGKEIPASFVRVSDATLALGGLSGPRVRGGVIPSGGDPLGYSATTGLNSTLKAGRYLLPAPSFTNGAYMVTLPADIVFTHDVADFTAPRSDLIIAEVRDAQDGTSYAQFRILKGTPAVNAPDPTNTASLGNGTWTALHRSRINAGSTSQIITDLRAYTGAVNPMARDDTQALGMMEGAVFYHMGKDRIGYRTSNGIETLQSTGYANGDWAVYQFGAYTITPNSLQAMGGAGITRIGGTLSTSDIDIVGVNVRLWKAGLYTLSFSSFIGQGAGAGNLPNMTANYRRFIDYEVAPDTIWGSMRASAYVGEDRLSLTGLVKVEPNQPQTIIPHIYQNSGDIVSFTSDLRIIRVDLK